MKIVTQNPAKLFSPKRWQQAVNFHGHACPGLAMGCRIALAAVQALDLDDSFLTTALADNGIQNISPDEELVCVAETDACGVDAVQSLLGCTLGKGNLILNFRGKHAMSFYHRQSEKAVRVKWIAVKDSLSREEKIQHYLTAPSSDLVGVVKIVHAPLPLASRSRSLACAKCGEYASETAIRMFEGQPFCLDCYPDQNWKTIFLPRWM